MSLFNRVLDQDEGSLAKVRSEAKLMIGLMAATVVALALFVLVMVVLDATGVINDDGEERPNFLVLILLFIVWQQVAVERYRRKKLEERVKTLEARAP